MALLVCSSVPSYWLVLLTAIHIYEEEYQTKGPVILKTETGT